MSSSEPIPVPTAGVRQRRRIPLIWIVPLVTALIAGWLAWDTWSKRGPTITVSFDSADGLQAGQSQLKFKDVKMGTVTSIAVSPDLSKVIVTIETTREAARLLTDKTIFWIVKPQLFAGNISARPALNPRQGANMTAYTASKAAVAAFTVALAEELKGENISVVALCPSTINTPTNRADMPKADHASWVKPAALAELIVTQLGLDDPVNSGALIPVYGKA